MEIRLPGGRGFGPGSGQTANVMGLPSFLRITIHGDEPVHLLDRGGVIPPLIRCRPPLDNCRGVRGYRPATAYQEHGDQAAPNPQVTPHQ